jgi:hypothetical protein
LNGGEWRRPRNGEFGSNFPPFSPTFSSPNKFFPRDFATLSRYFSSSEWRALSLEILPPAHLTLAQAVSVHLASSCIGEMSSPEPMFEVK